MISGDLEELMSLVHGCDANKQSAFLNSAVVALSMPEYVHTAPARVQSRPPWTNDVDVLLLRFPMVQQASIRSIIKARHDMEVL